MKGVDMTRLSSEPTAPATCDHRPPPLQSGDRLSREEFERRYDAMPELKKAELIDGVVYVPSPVNHRNHGNPHFNVIFWLGSYAALTPGVEGGDNSSLRLDPENEPQPDGFLIVLPAHGGRVQIDGDDYIVGGPELIGEVAASSASYDLHDKLNVYRRHGVREYIVWRVYDRTIDWFVLRQGKYERLPLAADGIYRSEVFPGLWLDPAALIQGNLQAVLTVLQQGLATPDHAAFVAELQKKAEK
jgi:Uma2 family endonuclease